jgi:hypothetical protein
MNMQQPKYNFKFHSCEGSNVLQSDYTQSSRGILEEPRIGSWGNLRGTLTGILEEPQIGSRGTLRNTLTGILEEPRIGSGGPQGDLYGDPGGTLDWIPGDPQGDHKGDPGGPSDGSRRI